MLAALLIIVVALQPLHSAARNTTNGSTRVGSTARQACVRSGRVRFVYVLEKRIRGGASESSR